MMKFYLLFILIFACAGITFGQASGMMSNQPIIRESQKTDRTAQLQEEVAELNKLLAREPNNIAALEMRAAHYFELKQWDTSIIDETRLIALKPNNLEDYFNRATCFEENQQFDQALADLDHLIKVSPQTDATFDSFDAYRAYYSRSLLRLKLKQTEATIADLTNILKFRPSDESAYQMRALIYQSDKEYVKAIGDYTELIRLNPRSSFGYYGRAEVYKILGELKKAEADISIANEILKKRNL